MLSLTKKTDYALISLGYLAARPDQTVSAREIAQTFNMPGALVMNVLKTLHHANYLASTRGTKGGYRLTADLTKLSVHELIEVLEGPVKLAECVIGDDGCPQGEPCKISKECPIQAPIQALHERLVSFLHEVKLADVVVNGRKIDAPSANVGCCATA